MDYFRRSKKIDYRTNDNNKHITGFRRERLHKARILELNNEIERLGQKWEGLKHWLEKEAITTKALFAAFGYSNSYEQITHDFSRDKREANAGKLNEEALRLREQDRDHYQAHVRQLEELQREGRLARKISVLFLNTIVALLCKIALRH